MCYCDMSVGVLTYDFVRRAYKLLIESKFAAILTLSSIIDCLAFSIVEFHEAEVDVLNLD